MLVHRITHSSLHNYKLALFLPFGTLLDLKGYHLMESNVKFKEYLNYGVLVYIQNQILEPFYHDHNLIIFLLQPTMLVNTNSFYDIIHQYNVKNLDFLEIN